MKKVIIALFCVFSMNAWAQKQTVKILTSAQCEGNCCKDRIEEEMQFTKGVTAVELDIESRILTVTFKTKKTDIDKIRTVVSKLGYNADDLKAVKEDYDKLPKCCQNHDFVKPKNE